MQENKPVLCGYSAFRDGVELHEEEKKKAFNETFPYTYTTPNGNVIHSMWPEDDPRRVGK